MDEGTVDVLAIAPPGAALTEETAPFGVLAGAPLAGAAGDDDDECIDGRDVSGDFFDIFRLSRCRSCVLINVQKKKGKKPATAFEIFSFDSIQIESNHTHAQTL